MTYDWIIDVISDLETFSSANEMDGLARELADLKLTAALEIAAKEARDRDAQHLLKTGQRRH